MITEAPRCDTCLAWTRDPNNLTQGACKRGPPTPMMMPMQTVQGNVMGMKSFWPQTGAGDGCHSHIPKQPKIIEPAT